MVLGQTENDWLVGQILKDAEFYDIIDCRMVLVLVRTLSLDTSSMSDKMDIVLEQLGVPENSTEID